MRVYQFSLLPVIFLGLSLTACTRPQGDGSSISLTIPLSQSSGQNLNSQASTNLNYVAINVSGPNMERIFCSWDLEDNRSQGCAFRKIDASTVAVELLSPNGEDRLFQVLMAYSSATDGNSMTFKYGEASTRISGESSVALAPEDIGGGAQSGGRLMGRYLNPNFPSGGPTDLLRVVITPKDGRPPMDLQLTEMYAGWFQAFSLENIQVDYILKSSGLSIFGEPMNKTKLVAKASNSGGAMMVDPPAIGAGEYSAFGYFGSAVATAGKTTMVASCAAGSHFETCLSKGSKFIGPFRSDVTGKMLTVTAGAPNKVSWNFLPGIDASVIDGVSVYTVASDLADADIQSVVMSRGFNCMDFRDKIGASLLGDVAVAATPQEISTGATVHIPNPKRPLAICPRMGSILRTAALVSPKLDNDGGCSDCKYLRFQITSYAESAGDKYRIGKLGCYPIQIGSYRGMGVASSDHTNPITMNFASPAWGAFYTDGQCSSGIANPSVVIPAGQNTSSGSLYIRAPAPGTSLQLAATISSDSSDGAILYQPQHNSVDVINPLTKVLLPSGPILPNVCYRGFTTVSMPNGMDLPVGASPIFDNLSGETGVRFAPDAANCASSVSGTLNQVMTTYPIQKDFWFKRITAGTVSVVAAPTSFDSTTATVATAASTLGTPVKVKITPVSSPLILGKCNEMRLELLNADNVVVPAPFATTIELQPADAVGFWSTISNCSSQNTTVSIPVQDSGASVYFFPINTTASFPVQIIGSSGLQPLPVAPPVALPVDVSQPWVKVVSRPFFPRGSSAQIGSHNFPITVGLAQSAGSTLKCYKGSSPPPPDSISWDDCSGRLVGVNLSFGVTEMGASPSETTHLLVKNGSLSSVLSLNKGILFGNGSFNITNCDVVVPAGTFDAVNSANATHSTICLDAGTFQKGAGTANAISMPSGKSLLGKINPATSTPATMVAATVSGATAALTLDSITSTVQISNIKFSMSGAGGSYNGIELVSGWSGSINTFANEFENQTATGGNSTGIAFPNGNTVGLNSTADFFNLKAFPGGGISTGINLVANGSTSYIRDGKFLYTSTGNSADGTVALSIAEQASGSTSYINVINSSFSGDGGAIRVIGRADNGSNLEVSVSNTIINAADTLFGAAYAIYTQDNVGMTMNDSSIRNFITGKPAYKYYQTISTGAYSGSQFIQMDRNVLQQHANAAAVFIGTAGLNLGSPREIKLESNHFVKMTGGNTAPAVQGTTGYSIYFVRNPASPSDGNNLGCGMGGADVWSGFYAGDSIAASANQWIPSSAAFPVYGNGLCSVIIP